MEQLKPNDQIHNGSTVIHYTHLSDRTEGGYAHGVALCLDACGGMAYAVWSVTYCHDSLGSNKWYAENGNYYEEHEFDQAYARYRKRAGLDKS